MSDKETIEFEQMLIRSRCILYKICFAFTDRQPDNVNDLYQEIVCNLWRGWRGFRSDSDVTSWVYRVALNTASMEVRKKKQEKRHFSLPKDRCYDPIPFADPTDPLVEHL